MLQACLHEGLDRQGQIRRSDGLLGLRDALLSSAQLRMSPAGPEWKDISQEARTCIKRMLVLEPSKRITAAGLLELPWLKNSSALSEKVRSHATTIGGHCGWTEADLHKAGDVSPPHLLSSPLCCGTPAGTAASAMRLLAAAGAGHPDAEASAGLQQHEPDEETCTGAASTQLCGSGCQKDEGQQVWRRFGRCLATSALQPSG